MRSISLQKRFLWWRKDALNSFMFEDIENRSLNLLSNHPRSFYSNLFEQSRQSTNSIEIPTTIPFVDNLDDEYRCSSHQLSSHSIGKKRNLERICIDVVMNVLIKIKRRIKRSKKKKNEERRWNTWHPYLLIVWDDIWKEIEWISLHWFSNVSVNCSSFVDEKWQ